MSDDETRVIEGENEREIVSDIFVEMMDWDLGRASYRIEGRLVAEEKAMIFDLTQAIELGWD